MADLLATDELDADPGAVAFEAPRTVCLQLDAGEGVAPHSHPGHDVLMIALDGTLAVGLGEDSYALSAGEVLRFEGEREVAPEGRTDATALVVLCER
jgi:mannose-6-phosphate isomerase-like protein (cupin superfamily)